MTSDTRYVSWTWTPGIQPPTDILKLLHLQNLQILFKTEGKMPSYLQKNGAGVCGKMPSNKKNLCTSKTLSMESWNPIMESWNPIMESWNPIMESWSIKIGDSVDVFPFHRGWNFRSVQPLGFGGYQTGSFPRLNGWWKLWGLSLHQWSSTTKHQGSKKNTKYVSNVCALMCCAVTWCDVVWCNAI